VRMEAVTVSIAESLTTEDIEIELEGGFSVHGPYLGELCVSVVKFAF